MTLRTLALSMIALRLGAQSLEEEQRKAKLAAERLHEKNAVQSHSAGDAQRSHDDKRSAEAMHAVIASGGSGPVVKGKPFSAEAVTETVQTLADGNRIIRHNLTRLYRDRDGRTRREQSIEALGPSSPIPGVLLIVISDPVASVDWSLDPSRKTARKFPRFETAGTQAPDGEQLGKRQIEGLDCKGTRTTRTIPAGGIGNERPIVSISESWYATAIDALVLSSTSDPRFGETHYRLKNIVIAEPPHNLFELPPGYKVEFEGRPGVMKNQN